MKTIKCTLKKGTSSLAKALKYFFCLVCISKLFAISLCQYMFQKKKVKTFLNPFPDEIKADKKIESSEVNLPVKI